MILAAQNASPAANRRMPLAGFQHAYVVATFLFITGAFGLLYMSLAPSAGSYDDRQGGTPLLQAISLMLYSPSLIFLIIYNNVAVRTLIRAWPLTLLVILAILSITWSVEPGVTLRRVSAMTLMFSFALYCAISFSRRQFLTIMLIWGGLLLFASLLAVGVPGVGLDPLGPYKGFVRGIFQEKNQFGRFAGLTLTMLAAFLMSERKTVAWRVPLLWGTLILGLGLLYAANARTPLVTFIAAFAAMWAARFLTYPTGWHKRFPPSIRRWTIAIALFLGIVVMPLLLLEILSLLGRDLTLTGRLKLWDYAINLGLQRPMLGAGFKAFWTDALTFDLRELHSYWEIEGAAAKNLTANAHNGYLDVWLELGFVGLGIFVTFLVSFARKAVRLMRESDDVLSIWYVGLLVFMLLYYLTNSEVLAHSDIGWFSMTFAYLSLAAREAAGRPVNRHGAIAEAGGSLADARMQPVHSS